MNNNKSEKTSSLDLSKIHESVKALDASIEVFLNVLSGKYSLNITNNMQQNFQQQKQCKNNGNFYTKKRVIKKLNTDLIKQILMETKKRKKESTKKQRVKK